VRAKIAIGWNSALLDNQAYVAGDTKLGHTTDCTKAMLDIKMLLTSVAHSFVADKERRIQVAITAFRPRSNIDAQNLVKACCDAIKHGIHVDDSYYDVEAIGKLDHARPRIEIEITQEEA